MKAVYRKTIRTSKPPKPKRRPKIRVTQVKPPEVFHSYSVRMPPSLFEAVEAEARKRDINKNALIREYLIRGLAGAGTPVGDWFFKYEDALVDDEDRIVEELRLDLQQFGEIVKFQRDKGFQTRRLAIEQLLALGLSYANNRGTGLGGRY